MKRGERPTLSVVCPCFNESESIDAFYTALKSVLVQLDGLDHEILFVEDGGTDGTLERLNAIAAADPNVRPYALSRNFGHQIALTAGMDAAAGDAVILMDSDLQHPPALIPEMVRRWRDGHDVVSCVRRRSKDAGALKQLGSSAFYWLVNRLSETPITPGAADFCLLSRRALDALRSMPEHSRFLRGMVSWIGFPRAFVEFDAPARYAGRSKYDLHSMVGLALDAIFSFSSAPLRLATRVGLTVVAAGVCYLVYIVVRLVLLGDLVPGWASAVGVVLVLGGTQLVFIGLIGQYLARIFDESKSRPLYLLKQTPDSIPQASPGAAVPRSRAARR